MPFLRNAWYVAAWATDVAPKAATRIQIMGEWIALFRDQAGALSAIGDRCPHRFASLSQGKVVGDRLECPYHGLQFDGQGRCVHNPHGDGALPPALPLANYTLAERYGAVWIWMGDREVADPLLIPDFTLFESPDYATSQGYLHVQAPYGLVTDNLLDLTHAAYIHPFLASKASISRTRTSVDQQGTTVRYNFWIDDEPITPLFQLVWTGESKTAQLRSHMRWTAPSNLLLDVGMTAENQVEEDSPAFPSAHLLTPETETTTHYFWIIGRNRHKDDEDIGRLLHAGVSQAFTQEDEPMISRVHENMAGQDFWTLRPLVLAGDAAAIRARRILAKLIKDEQTPQTVRKPEMA